MKTFVTAVALALVCGSAFCAETPALRRKPAWRSPERQARAKPDGSIDTTGMSATKGNIKRERDGAPAPKDEKK